MSSSVHEELEKSCLSRGLSEALEQLMQLIVRDCIIVWLRDITSDHDCLTQLLMSVKLLFFCMSHNYHVKSLHSLSRNCPHHQLLALVT